MKGVVAFLDLESLEKRKEIITKSIFTLTINVFRITTMLRVMLKKFNGLVFGEFFHLLVCSLCTLGLKITDECTQE